VATVPDCVHEGTHPAPNCLRRGEKAFSPWGQHRNGGRSVSVAKTEMGNPCLECLRKRRPVVNEAMPGYRSCSDCRSRNLIHVRESRARAKERYAERLRSSECLDDMNEICRAIDAAFRRVSEMYRRPVPKGKCRCVLGENVPPSKGVCGLCGLPDGCESCGKREPSCEWRRIIYAFRPAFLCEGCRAKRQRRAFRNARIFSIAPRFVRNGKEQP